MVKINKYIFLIIMAVFIQTSAIAFDVNEIQDFSSRSIIINKMYGENEPAGEIKNLLREKKLSLTSQCLIEQIKRNNIDNIKFLLDAGVNPNISYMAEHPIYIAAKENRYEIVKLLLDYKARLDRGFFSELYEAVKNKNNEMAQLLIENGAGVNYSDSVTSNTILYTALKNNMLDTASLLISKGAKPDIKSIKLIKKKKLYSLIEENIQ